ncbi:uncharacterized protein LOC135366059 [Ornithodoros turicata]|uniref:uncharacterized protein LOC135366059 n=1 Tax=Ornithodoros turicata TaxID=34597 RepID=UPI00313974BC
MDWNGLLKNLVNPNVRCFYAAVHSVQTGKCLDYLPFAIYPGASGEEVRDLAKCHREPLLLYGHGATIAKLRYTFLKMEGPHIILLRRPDVKCAVGFANTVVVIAVYPVNAPSQPIVLTLQEMCDQLIRQCY